jgi:hypothetical protein
MRKLVDRALDGADSEPLAEQIDLHQAAAVALEPFDKEGSELAAFLAALKRQAESHQLKFRELLRS